MTYNDLYQTVLNGRPATMTWEMDGIAYIRDFRPKERLILLGGGHIAQPLCKYGADLGFAVTVVDDRPSFANRTRFLEAAEVICDVFPIAISDLRIHASESLAQSRAGAFMWI